MSRDGNGVYSLPTNSWNPAINGNSATPVDWQALIDDVAAALTQSVSADGQTPMTGDLNMNGNRIESLAAGTSTTDAANVGQIYSQGTETDVASAATTDIGIVNSNFIRITGTTTITSLGTTYRGPRFVRFAGILTLTHNATTLILPGGANITTAAGDRAIFVPKGSPSDGWNCVVYEYATGGKITGNLSVTGSLSVTVDSSITGNSTVTGDLTVDGNVTLGNAGSDTVTANGALSATNGVVVTGNGLRQASQHMIGYNTGGGGNVTQATSKATAVTLNTASGRITMNNSIINANSAIEFQFNNSLIDGDTLVLLGISGNVASANSYCVGTRSIGGGGVVIGVRNLTAGNLSEAIQLTFALHKTATS